MVNERDEAAASEGAAPEPDTRIAPPVNESRLDAPQAKGSGKRVKALVLGAVSLALVVACSVGIVFSLGPESEDQGADVAAGQVQAAQENEGAQEADAGAQQGSSSAGSDADAEKDDASSASDGSNGSSAASAETPSSSMVSDAKASSSDVEEISVTFSIDGSRAQGYDVRLARTRIQLAEGASVYDALVASGADIGGNATYVSSIDGLAEFACGNGSGWMYSVNGAYPNKSCGDYVLHDGDVVVWVYTCDLGNDL